MKYNSGGLTNDNRGSIGGITFSKNGNCNYARARKMPADPHSSGQLSVRALTGLLAQSWRGLSRLQQQVWINTACQYPKHNSIGQTFYLSGFQFFMELNRNIQVCGGTVILDCPDIALNLVAIPDNFIVDIISTYGTEDIKISFNNSLAANLFMIVYASGKVSNGIRSAFSYKKITICSDSFTSGDSIKSDYEKVFGTLPGTDEISFFKARCIDPETGYSSGFVIYRSIGTM